MKNQYFGDVNDYRKYGLLRSILAASDLRMLVAWMLTPDDDRSDGNFTDYLSDDSSLGGHDPQLFAALRAFLADGQQRTVALIEQSELLPRSRYFSQLVPDKAKARGQWFRALRGAAQDTDIVFLDPDNGIEVRSVRYGRRNSSKYVFWREVEELAAMGKSLVIYQHFRRENRDAFVARMKSELQQRTRMSFVVGRRTSHVLFLVAAQESHRDAIEAGLERSWLSRAAQ
jgi:hypothetical protein